jgi:hypothetical protein
MTTHAEPEPAPPTWQRLAECPRCIAYRPHLTRTVLTALVVGTVLFAINQLDIVLAGQATASTWIKIGATYLVPFCVANYGLLIACRRPPQHLPSPPIPAPAPDPDRSGQ